MAYRNTAEDAMTFSVVGFFVLLFIAAAVGWVWNIVKLFGVINDPVTGMEIARGFGVFMPPLGAILGFL